MKAWFFTLVMVVRIVQAMDEPCRLDETSLPVIFCTAKIDVDDLLSLSGVCKAFNVFFDERNWQFHYRRIKGRPQKLCDAMTFKENCKLLIRSRAICQTSPPHCSLGKDVDLVLPPRIDVLEMVYTIDSAAVARVKADVLHQLTDIVEKTFPLVVATCFGPFYGDERSDDPSAMSQKFTCFDRCLAQDVLLIVSVGYGNAQLSSQIAGNVHERWPNVLWVTHLNEGNILPQANVGSLVHLAAEASSSKCCALSLAPLVILMRHLRLDLRAADIIKILVNSSIKTDNTKMILPNAGILDVEAALMQLQSFVSEEQGH